MPRQFDSNTQALKEREKLNHQGSNYNLEEWIINQIRLKPNMSVLDLGCGTGKQIFALSKQIDNQSQFLGFDISTDAVNEVLKRAKTEKLNNITAIQGNLDDAMKILKGKKFDLIISTYAIYYAKNMPKLLINLKTLLKPLGQLFVCGNGQGSNQEIISLVNSLIKPPLSKLPSVTDFISESEIKEVAKSYSETETIRLANKIQFHNTEDVLTWWKNHNTYVPEVEVRMTEIIKKHFKDNRSFSVTKNIIGIHYDI